MTSPSPNLLPYGGLITIVPLFSDGLIEDAINHYEQEIFNENASVSFLQHAPFQKDMKNLLFRAPHYIGARATFTYFERTKKGSYRHPLFKSIRDYE